jgi:alkanesulfonate monooxygenase SsuD/methylene tetrahydromethanopterin reductase-like flavin-dependent oxidoreductase (luciferase family)
MSRTKTGASGIGCRLTGFRSGGPVCGESGYLVRQLYNPDDVEDDFERVARFGDGWTILWLRPAALRSAREELLDAWEAQSRAGLPEISVVRPVDVDAATDRDRSRPLVGAPGKVVRDVEAYLDAGATRITITFFEGAVEEQVRQAERFGEEVIAQFG